MGPQCANAINGSPVCKCNKWVPSVLRRSRSCWTSATDQAGTLSLARVLGLTSAMRWVGIMADDDPARDEELLIAGFKTPLHVLRRQPRCLCVEMFLVIFSVVLLNFDN